MFDRTIHFCPLFREGTIFQTARYIEMKYVNMPVEKLKNSLLLNDTTFIFLAHKFALVQTLKSRENHVMYHHQAHICHHHYELVYARPISIPESQVCCTAVVMNKKINMKREQVYTHSDNGALPFVESSSFAIPHCICINYHNRSLAIAFVPILWSTVYSFFCVLVSQK